MREPSSMMGVELRSAVGGSQSRWYRNGGRRGCDGGTLRWARRRLCWPRMGSNRRSQASSDCRGGWRRKAWGELSSRGRGVQGSAQSHCSLPHSQPLHYSRSGGNGMGGPRATGHGPWALLLRAKAAEAARSFATVGSPLVHSKPPPGRQARSCAASGSRDTLVEVALGLDPATVCFFGSLPPVCHRVCSQFCSCRWSHWAPSLVPLELLCCG